MSQFKEVWVFWYNAQLQEVENHRRRFSEEKPTLRPASSFDPEEDAEVLRGAMKGFGTDEDKIIDILAYRSTEQRLEIREKYQQVHGRDLIKDLKSELGGAFEKVILALMKPRPLLLAESIKNATKGAGTDERALIEIFCSRDDESIESIKKTFEEEYEISLEKVICKETTGAFETLMMSILATCRNDDSSPREVAEQLASEEVTADDIRKICTSYTLPFLNKVFIEYLELIGEEFISLVDKKCSGECKKAYSAIYECANSRTEFYAKELHAAMKGYGTDDTALIRIIVSRCEIDLGTIKEKFEKIFEQTLEEALEKEISGDYGKTFLALVR